MRLTPAAVPASDYAVARKPSIGAEKRVYLSEEATEELGELEWVATGSGTWTPDTVTQIPATGADLTLVVEGQLLSNAATTVYVEGTDPSNNPITGSGTFGPPGYVENKTFGFQHGAAVDVVAGAKFKTVTGLRVGAGGFIRSRVKLMKMPDNWVFMGCVDSVEPSVGTRPPVQIPCGFKGSAFVVAGRSEPNNLTIRAKHFSVVDGLNRYAGRNCTVRLDMLKSGYVLTERHVFGNAVLGVTPNFPDGNDEVADAATGLFEHYAGFFAP